MGGSGSVTGKLPKRVYPETPELDKLSEVSEFSQEVGAFLDWLSTEAQLGPTQGEGRRAAIQATRLKHSPIRLCLFHEEEDEWHPVGLSINEILARYYEIDLGKVEAERAAVLEYVRAQNEE